MVHDTLPASHHPFVVFNRTGGLLVKARTGGSGQRTGVLDVCGWYEEIRGMNLIRSP